MIFRGVSSLLGGITLSLLVAACAGPMAQGESGALPGTWHGAFVHGGADYTSPSRADLTLQVKDDSTYTFKWGSRAETTGTIAAEGNRVILDDSSGTRITLMRSGDTLYGVMKDTATGRAASMSLAKDEAGATQLARRTERLCQAAGGVFADGVCQPAVDQTLVAQQCEARGGVYFAADYCEMPAGGLRRR